MTSPSECYPRAWDQGRATVVAACISVLGAALVAVFTAGGGGDPGHQGNSASSVVVQTRPATASEGGADGGPVWGVRQVRSISYWTRGGAYSATVTTVDFQSDFISVALDSQGPRDLRKPDESCLIDSSGRIFRAYDFLATTAMPGRYVGTVRFVNSKVKEPLRFRYACLEGYQDIAIPN